MKIERVTLYPLVARLEEPFGWSQRWTDTRATVVVRIDTDEGLSGWGESPDFHGARSLAPLLIGEDPRRTETLWQRFHALNYQHHRFAGAFVEALSAFDIALWDLRGKAAGRPVCELLGGPVRDRLTVYATGLYYREDDFPAKLTAEALGYAEAGFPGMKMKVGAKPVAEDAGRVHHLRRELGNGLHLMIDANEAYDARAAIDLAGRVAEADITWFEEPCASYDDEANLRVREHVAMPVAGGESLQTRYEFAPRLARRVFDIIQPDIVNVGGVSEFHKVAAMANAFGVQVNPHFWGTGISLAATLHVAACFGQNPPALNHEPFVNEPVVELDSTPHPIRESLTDPIFRPESGGLTVPRGPGLGVSIDEGAIAAFLDGDATVIEESAAGMRFWR